MNRLVGMQNGLTVYTKCSRMKEKERKMELFQRLLHSTSDNNIVL
mgnify:CR=1 FL=1